MTDHRVNTIGALRQMLTVNADGMTLVQMCHALGKPSGYNIRQSLDVMPDVYIDRWLSRSGRNGGQRYAAVYCRAVPPDDCPEPE